MRHLSNSLGMQSRHYGKRKVIHLRDFNVRIENRKDSIVKDLILPDALIKDVDCVL